MNKQINPTELGLPPRTIVEQIDKNTLSIVINRKSRIIMVDGRKIVEKVNSIQEKRAEMKVIVKILNAPVCKQDFTVFKR